VGKFKQPAKQAGGRIAAPVEHGAGSSDKERPIFSFEHLQKGYCISDCESSEKVALADKLREMSQLTWEQLRNAGRKGMGYEKIARSAINPSIPAVATEDVNLIAFRFCGNAPFVGFRVHRVFHVLWLDRSFTLYDHE
jgi:hypothetical protein